LDSKSSIRVIHCPTMIGGNPQGLARAERELGLKSWAISFRPAYFDYETDEVLLNNGNNQVILEVKRWQLLWRILKHFDIVHFNFGQSIMPTRLPSNVTRIAKLHPLLRWIYQGYTSVFELRDLAWLKQAGKGIVVTYQGDDARQGDYCSTHFEITAAHEVEQGYYSPESDTHKRWRIARFADYADRIYALNPDLLHILPSQAQFLPYSHIDLRKWQVSPKSPEVKYPVVLHAPSHRGFKGTRFILDAISKLQGEGINFEFVLVEGLSQAKARQLYEQADLLVDQVLAGWYGGLAVELMALGKPVICYIREGDLKFIPAQMREELPIINTTPATIYNVLKEWLTVRRHEIPERGQRSRTYVEKWHNPLTIAAKLKSDYEIIIESKRPRNQTN
jgi:glycosyltransferase involved in cell wall biosynthesis